MPENIENQGAKNNNIFFNRLFRILSPNPILNLHATASRDRSLVEQYISEQFQASYRATISDFMPQLFTMSCQDGLCAVAGIRHAGKQALFLEQYLPATAESALSHIAGKAVSRDSICEIGNLVATQRGSSQLLFLLLAGMLEQTDIEWLVFTATPQVESMINRLGINLHTLCDANPAQLATSNLESWGTYYENQPKVLAGNLREALIELKKKKLYMGIYSLFQNRISELASIIDHKALPYEKSACAA